MPRHALPVLVLAALVLVVGCARRTRDAGEAGGPAAAPARRAGEVAFIQDEYWHKAQATFSARFDLAQPLAAKPGGGWAYAGRKDPAKLVLDLYATSHARLPGAPEPAGPSLANAVATVQVYSSDRSHPLATCKRRDLAYARGNLETFEHGRSGRLVATVERWRIPCPQLAAVVRDGHPYLVTVVALDAQGLTVACEDVAGDEAVEAMAPAAPLAR